MDEGMAHSLRAAAAAGTAGVTGAASTAIPGRTFWRPSTMTWFPYSRPVRKITPFPWTGPSSARRLYALPSFATAHTLRSEDRGEGRQDGNTGIFRGVPYM